MRNWLWAFGFLVVRAVTTLGAEPAMGPASPLSPEESQKHFQIDPDCRIELVAAEPDVSAPVSIAFDEKGQLWVVEMHDYPNGPAPGEPGKSRIRVLTDEDGDGKYSHPRVFVDQLLFANGLMHWDGGVLVTTDGKLIYFKDTDGDGKSDLREVWFEGFATENPQLRCNHPTFGPDNWIYVANGLRNGKVKAVRPKWPKPAPESAKLGEPVDIAGRDFRFNPFTGECEAVSGYGQFGLTFDDEGNRYVCSNRNPCMKIIIEERHLKLNPNLAVPSVYEDVSPAGEKSKLYPISRAWTTSNLHAGQFSAACGLIFYRGTALPKKFYNESFTCDPTGNLVQFNNEKYNEAKREFLASDETWFRPVNTAMGPDGALYIVDMYRAVIEHPDYMPVELKTRPDLGIGAERGRIWRIVATTKEPGSVSPRSEPHITRLPSDAKEIAKLVNQRNGWLSDTAHRLLVEKQMVEATDELWKLIVYPKTTQSLRGGSAVALRALDGLGQVKSTDLSEIIRRDVEFTTTDPMRSIAFRYPSEPHLITRDAIRLAERFVADDPELVKSIIEFSQGKYSRPLTRDIHLTLGQLKGAESEARTGRAVQDLIRSDTDAATEIAIGLGQAPFLATVLAETLDKMVYRDHEADGKNFRNRIPQNLLATATRSAKREQLAAILDHLVDLKDYDGISLVGEGLKPQQTTPGQFLKESEYGDTDWQYLVNGMVDEVAECMTLAQLNELTPSRRLDFLSILQCLKYVDDKERVFIRLRDLLWYRPPSDIAIVAIRTAATLPDAEAIELLLHVDPRQHMPVVRSAIISALLTSEPRITKLLDIVESNQFTFLEIGQTRLASLQQVKNPEIQERLQKLIAANAPADRSKVLEEYQSALTHEHDPLRGRELFAKNCAQCHKIGDLGVEVAPNISDSRVKTQAQLLTDILDPNRAIDNNYFSYTLVDKAGTVATGIISAETSSSVTLKQPEGKTLTVLRSDIEQLKPNGVSLMPVGFEKQLTVAQMADVISFIKNWRYLDGQVPKEVIK